MNSEWPRVTRTSSVKGTHKAMAIASSSCLLTASLSYDNHIFAISAGYEVGDARQYLGGSPATFCKQQVTVKKTWYGNS